MDGGLVLVNNEDDKQFELFFGGSISKINYKKIGDVYYLNHVEVPKELEGEGIGATLMEKALDHIKTTGCKFIANCTFAKVYVDRHPGWKKIMK